MALRKQRNALFRGEDKFDKKWATVALKGKPHITSSSRASSIEELVLPFLIVPTLAARLLHVHGIYRILLLLRCHLWIWHLPFNNHKRPGYVSNLILCGLVANILQVMLLFESTT